MKGLFSYDSPFMQVLYKICTCCCLNAIWLLCSLPIVTAGAATTALYSVCIKLIRGQEGAVYSQYFRSFKQNFKQATQLWLMLLGLGIVLGVDAYALYHLRQTTTGPVAVFWTILFAIIIAASIIYAIVLTYTFPVLSYFDNNNRGTLLNALRVGVQYLFVTLVIFAIHIVVAYVTINLFTPLAMFGMGLCAITSSFFLSSVFYNISGEKKPAKTDEEAADEDDEGDEDDEDAEEDEDE